MQGNNDGIAADSQQQRHATKTQLAGLGAALAAATTLYAVFINHSLGTVGGRRMFVLIDDAMISMRFAKNLAEGHGLIWNPGGDAVEGYTNLLWTLWMALLHVVLPDRLVGGAVIVTGAVLLLIGIWLAFLLARRLAPNSTIAPIAAAFLTAVCYPLAFWTLRGLEVGLVSVIFTAALVIACDLFETPSTRKTLMLGVLVSLGLLTRPDTIVVAITTFAVLMLFVSSRQRKEIALYGIGPLVLTGLALSAFRIAYYDALLPNTYALKVENFSMYRRVRRGSIALTELVTKGGVGVVAALGLVGIVRGWIHRRPQAVLVGAAVVGVFAYSVYVGGDAWEDFRFANRYVSAILPALFALAGAGLAALFEHRDFRARKPLAVIAVLLIAMTVLAATRTLPPMDATDVAPNPASKFLVVGAVIVALAIFGASVLKANRMVLLALSLIAIGGMISCVDGRSLAVWKQSQIAYGRNDYLWANFGEALRQNTTPDATTVVTAAGNISYFIGSDRATIDGLGKMDPVIAHQLPHKADYPPGHQKWSHERSIRDLRPDVVAQMFFRNEADVKLIESWGYESIEDVFVRKDSQNVNRDALRTWLVANPH